MSIQKRLNGCRLSRGRWRAGNNQEIQTYLASVPYDLHLTFASFKEILSTRDQFSYLFGRGWYSPLLCLSPPCPRYTDVGGQLWNLGFITEV